MTDGQTLLQNVGQKLHVIGSPITNDTTAGSAYIDIEADCGRDLFMYYEHAIGLGEESTKPSQVFLEVS